MHTVAIVGNANVGKSTLFNRLVVQGADKNIAHDMPGVTRDYKIAEAKLFKSRFNLIDTAGFITAHRGGLSGKIDAQTNAALARSNLILFVVDARAGLTSLDKSAYALLRQKNLPIIVVVNKCDDKRNAQEILSEFYTLNNTDMCTVSAEHNLGLDALHKLLLKHIGLTTPMQNVKSDADEENLAVENKQPIRIAILGRPNVGKSTLINSLLGQERLISGPEAGITRDTIAIDLKYKERDIQVLDTAGIRRKVKVQDQLEKLSVGKCIQAIDLCHIAVLLIDINNPLEQQDLKIAELIHKRLKPMIVAVNKVDSVRQGKELIEEIEFIVQRKLAQGDNMPLVYVSALRKKNLNKILDECIKLYDARGVKISTSKLNAWLQQAMEAHQAPLSGSGRRLKIKFMSQVKVYPPTFRIFMSNPNALPDSYLKYLISSMKDNFKFLRGPIAIKKVKVKNPYA